MDDSQHGQNGLHRIDLAVVFAIPITLITKKPILIRWAFLLSVAGTTRLELATSDVTGSYLVI
jgi:hypothetical protein